MNQALGALISKLLGVDKNYGQMNTMAPELLKQEYYREGQNFQSHTPKVAPSMNDPKWLALQELEKKQLSEMEQL